jgi:hypothetical protein
MKLRLAIWAILLLSGWAGWVAGVAARELELELVSRAELRGEALVGVAYAGDGRLALVGLPGGDGTALQLYRVEEGGELLEAGRVAVRDALGVGEGWIGGLAGVASDPAGRGFSVVVARPEAGSGERGRLLFFDHVTFRPLARVGVGVGPVDVAFSPCGGWLAVVNEGVAGGVGSLTLIDLGAVRYPSDVVKVSARTVELGAVREGLGEGAGGGAGSGWVVVGGGRAFVSLPGHGEVVAYGLEEMRWLARSGAGAGALGWIGLEEGAIEEEATEEEATDGGGTVGVGGVAALLVTAAGSGAKVAELLEEAVEGEGEEGDEGGAVVGAGLGVWDAASTKLLGGGELEGEVGMLVAGKIGDAALVVVAMVGDELSLLEWDGEDLVQVWAEGEREEGDAAGPVGGMVLVEDVGGAGGILLVGRGGARPVLESWRLR